MYILTDKKLKSIYKNRIIQTDNSNSNSELFIDDNQVLKIYPKEDATTKHNIKVVKELLNKKEYFNQIKEFILPNDLIIYNDYIVGHTMDYINGNTLDEIINNNLLTNVEIKDIFIKLLDIINNLKDLPFTFYFGDLHEKNIMLDKYNQIYIIDCDRIVINNKKQTINNNIIIGKYLNNHYDNEVLKDITINGDYFCLLCMILNYLFKEIINNTYNPIDYLNNHIKNNKLNNLLKRTVNIKSFTLNKQDIDDLFNINNNYEFIEYTEEDLSAEVELTKELKRIRSLLK